MYSIIAFEVFNLSIILITSLEQVGARKNESLTLSLFGEFNSVKPVAGNNSAIFSQRSQSIHSVSKK